MAETKTIEGDHAMSPAYQVKHPAYVEILGGNYIAVEQNDRWPFTLLDVMQADAVHRNELPQRRMFVLGPSRAIDVIERHCCEGGCRRGHDCAGLGRFQSTAHGSVLSRRPAASVNITVVGIATAGGA